MDLCRRLAALEGRIRPAPGPEATEAAREELNRRLDRVRERMIANGDLHEDDDGALCLPDGTRLADLGTVGDLLQDLRVRRLAGAVAAADECPPAV